MKRRVLVPMVAVVVAGAAAVAVVQPWSDDDGGGALDASTTTTPVGDETTTSVASPPAGEPGADGVGDPYFPLVGNGGYDVDHYTLDLTWRADEGELDGVTTVEAVATQDLSRFDLDLLGMEVRSVTVGGETADIERRDRELVITPSQPIAKGDDFTTIVTYSGAPEPITEGTDLFATGWQTDGREAFVASEPTGAATFFPNNDHPTDKATYTFRITAPADQVVAANGLLAARDDIGHGTTSWTYEMRDPMASYLVQIAIGDYELVDGGEVEGVTIRHAFHRTLADDARALAAKTGEMIQVLDDIYGPYPFEAYGLLAVDEPLGFALETQSLTLIGSDIAGQREGAAITVLHELSHQWVGNSVSASTWKDIWLDEGFASYTEWLYSERTGGRSARDIARQFEGSTDFDLGPGDPGSNELFSGTVYIRGGMTLQALRERVGDDAFFEILRAWVDEHRGGTASTQDFIALAERVSGEDLGELFQAWLYDEGLPNL